MKIACGTVNFRKYPLTEAFQHIAKAGYEYVEPQAAAAWCPHVDVDHDDPLKYLQLVQQYGFKGSTAMWSTHGSLISDPLSVEYGKRCIEWAASAAIPVVNIGDGFKPDGMSDDEAWQILADRLQDVLETADKCHVYLAIEPHGSFSLTAAGLTRMMGLSSSPYLGINYDAANIHRAAYVESHGDTYTWKKAENGQDEVGTLGAIVDRVRHFHIKDLSPSCECVALGEGEVNNADCLALLHQHGYEGAISLETEGELDADATQQLIEKSREYMLRVLKDLVK